MAQESTLAAAMTQLSAEHNDADIGQPLAGTALAVLDRNAHPTVIGATGELLLRAIVWRWTVLMPALMQPQPGHLAPSRPRSDYFGAEIWPGCVRTEGSAAGQSRSKDMVSWLCARPRALETSSVSTQT